MKTTELPITSQTSARSDNDSPINPVSIAGLSECIEDARRAAVDTDAGPPEPNVYAPLLGRLEAARASFPLVYRQAMVTPFINSLRQLGEHQFNRILAGDPQRQGIAGLMMDIAQALLQHGEDFVRTATDAFEEVVSDLYDGFLSAEDRHGVNPPDRGVIAPLVKWGKPDFGAYTWPVDATSLFNCTAAVVNLPPANSRRGLVGWAALGHETAGHDILHADTGLPEELSMALQRNLRSLGHHLDQYWSTRIDETASDVMGILNLGPAAAIGLVAYFRAINAAFTGQPKLRSTGPEDDPHPADVLRGYLAAATVSVLKFSGSSEWSRAIADETDKDVETIVLAGQVVSKDIARQSAKIVAQTLAGFQTSALEHHALSEIQNWTDLDELKVAQVRAALRNGQPVTPSPGTPIYAAHVVAAAVTEALAEASSLQPVFDQMLALLDALRAQNPARGPVLLAHRGNLRRNLVYQRQTILTPPAVSRRRQLVSAKIARRRKSVKAVKLSPAR